MRRYTITVNNTQKVIDVEATGANDFRVYVDGRTVDVTLDDHRDLQHVAPISPSIQARPGAAPARPDASAPVSGGAAPAPKATAPAASAPRAAAPTGGARDKMTAPMPGVILSIATSVGATVKRGDTLMVLEAMKMKNELKAPADGTVAEIYVTAGQQVKFGEFLVRFEG